MKNYITGLSFNCFLPYADSHIEFCKGINVIVSEDYEQRRKLLHLIAHYATSCCKAYPTAKGLEVLLSIINEGGDRPFKGIFEKPFKDLVNYSALFYREVISYHTNDYTVTTSISNDGSGAKPKISVEWHNKTEEECITSHAALIDKIPYKSPFYGDHNLLFDKSDSPFDSILLIDEVDRYILEHGREKVVNTLISLVKRGVQIILTTDDFLLHRTISLLAEYSTDEENHFETTFISLFTGFNPNVLQIDQADTCGGLEHNPILDAYEEHYKFELDLRDKYITADYIFNDKTNNKI